MTNKKVKVLYFVDRLRHGGIQQLLIDILNHINKEKVQIDVLVFNDGEKYPLEEKVKDLGINLYKINGWIRTPISYLKQKIALDRFFSEHHDYHVIHLNSSSKNFLVLKEAKKYGIPIRIAHAHNVKFQTKNKIKIKIGNILKNKLIKYSTDFFACSELAGKWLFGESITKSKRFKIIHNAVDYNKFKLNIDVRNRIRKELDIDKDCILFGNVGRFTNQKNHTFLIDIFYEIHKENANSKLILIGIGEKEEEIKQKVSKLKLKDDVIFAGFKNNANEYMSAMDVFLMPSLFEGFPVAIVEAQVSGMPCFLSDRVTEEVKIADNVKLISLDKSAKDWKNEILSSDLKRKDNKSKLKQEGYFIEDMVEELENFYHYGRKNEKKD